MYMLKLLTFVVFLFYYCIPLYANVENISSPIIIEKSNQIIDGQYKVLKLNDNLSIPIMIIGDSSHIEPSFKIHDITIKNFILDGNSDNQPYEIWNNVDNGIRNNGITIRGAEHVTIDNCIVYNCRSGGIVIEKESKYITIKNTIVKNNFYDGIASCFSTNVSIINCISFDNKGAGMSFDWLFNNNSIENNIIYNNDVGIFMRWSNDNVFKNNVLKNKSFDFYFNQRDKMNDTYPLNFKLENNVSSTNFFGK
jgi:parallel beta-helix repeat protein